MNETREFLIPTKHSPTYGIHLHVDDSPQIAADGENHGFKALHISLHDTEWPSKVLQTASLFEALTNDSSYDHSQ